MSRAGGIPVVHGGEDVKTAIPDLLLRRGAVDVAAGRAAIGLAALARPAVPSRPWVGAAVDDLAARVFARTLGGRDVALGLGALAALRAPGTDPGQASTWVAAGAISDTLDVAPTLSSWRDLPPLGRWPVAGSAAGAALIAAAAASLRLGQPPA